MMLTAPAAHCLYSLQRHQRSRSAGAETERAADVASRIPADLTTYSISGRYLRGYAGKIAQREDNRRVASGTLFAIVVKRACGPECRASERGMPA